MDPVTFEDTRHPKDLAKRLRSALSAEGPPPLSSLQGAVARALGHADWNALDAACRPGGGGTGPRDVAVLRYRLACEVAALGVDAAPAASAAARVLPEGRPGGPAPVGVAAAFEAFLAGVKAFVEPDEAGRPRLDFDHPALPDPDDRDPWEDLPWIGRTPDGVLVGVAAIVGLAGDAIEARVPPEAPLPAGWTAPDPTASRASPDDDGRGGFMSAFEAATPWRVGDRRADCLRVLRDWARRTPAVSSFLADLDPVGQFAAHACLPGWSHRDLHDDHVGDRDARAVASLLLRAPVLGAVFATATYPYLADLPGLDAPALERHLEDLLVAGGLPFETLHRHGDRPARLPPLGRAGFDALTAFPFRLPIGTGSAEDEDDDDLVGATAVLIVAGLGRLGRAVDWTPEAASALVALSSLCAPLVGWEGDGEPEVDPERDEGRQAPECVPALGVDGVLALLAPHAGDLPGLVASLDVSEEASGDRPSRTFGIALSALGRALDRAGGLAPSGRAARLRHRLHERGLAAVAAEARPPMRAWRANRFRGPLPAPPPPDPSWGPERVAPAPLPSDGPVVTRREPVVAAAFAVRVFQSYGAADGEDRYSDFVGSVD